MVNNDSNWNSLNAFDRNLGSVYPPSWPNEMLVKLINSRAYSEIMPNFPSGTKVLEVGIFSGNNARLFIEKRWQIFGTELNEDLIQMCVDNLTRLDYEIPELKVGTNLSIPYPDQFFDLLVSINTLHYSASEESNQALVEFSRVMKPGGVAIIETAGRNHFAVERASRKNELDWTWMAGGFREGQNFGFFDNKEHFEKSLLKIFSKVEVAVRQEKYSKHQLEFYVGVCVK